MLNTWTLNPNRVLISLRLKNPIKIPASVHPIMILIPEAGRSSVISFHFVAAFDRSAESTTMHTVTVASKIAKSLTIMLFSVAL